MTKFIIAYQITEWREKTIEAVDSEAALKAFAGIVTTNPSDVLYAGSTVESRKVDSTMTFCRGMVA